MAKAIQKIDEAAPPAEVVKVDPALTIVERFLSDPSVPVERVEQAFDFYSKMRADQARRAFDAAMSEARAKVKPIMKNRTVSHDTKNGGTKTYQHEDLAEVARMVDPILAEFGLSYRFRTSSEINEPVRVTCIVSHRDGYSEENSLVGPRDDSGNKNSLQALGSTITYLQRYTLKAALGVAAYVDDDGKAAGATATINEDQKAALDKLLSAPGQSLADFCNYFNIGTLDELKVSDYERAVQAISKRARK